MKKYLTILLMILLSGGKVFADNQADAISFFNSYVEAANTYSQELPNFYSPKARIIRQVIKPDGELVNRETDVDRYVSEMKKSQALAKVRKYKNNYSDISAAKINDSTYKVTALRQPTGETYKLKTYMIVQKQASGNWLIIEEMMQTKVQLLLHAK